MLEPDADPTMRQQDGRYTNVAIALHWLIGIAILAMLVIGFTMARFLHTPGYQALGFKLFQLHKSIGITILILAVLRLLWRLTHRAPPLPADMPRHEKLAAEGTHVLLYCFMIGMPLVGWAYISASPFTIPTVLAGALAAYRVSVRPAGRQQGGGRARAAGDP